jgi:hypothetical protein
MTIPKKSSFLGYPILCFVCVFIIPMFLKGIELGFHASSFKWDFSTEGIITKTILFVAATLGFWIYYDLHKVKSNFVGYVFREM